MGLFSWNCKKCGHSIKSPYNIPTGWEYMGQAVFLREGHEPMIGEYDGYGRIDEYDLQQGDYGSNLELWHKVCWENAGKPEYTGDSEYSDDQGYFYDDPSEEETMEAIDATK